MKHVVYVSHAYEDKSIADAIYGKLESAHLKCWKADLGHGSSRRLERAWSEGHRGPVE